MSLRLLFAYALREARGSTTRLIFFAACVAVGVASVVSVAALGELVESGMRARSRELLGGDVALESRRPFGDLARSLPARQRAVPRVELAILPSMVRAEHGASQLAELKAIDTSRGPYPLAGALSLRPAASLESLLNDHTVLVASELLAALRLAPGAVVSIGSARFRIAGVVESEPDPVSFSFALGPRVLMTRGGLERAKLLGFASRARYRALFLLPSGSSARELEAFKSELLSSVPGAGAHVSVETHAEAQPALRSALARTQSYLGLVALLSLLIAGVGVAQIVAAWVAKAVPQTAVLRCLGVRPRTVVLLYATNVLLVSTLGSLLGAALGATAPLLLAARYRAELPAALDARLPLRALALGSALGVLLPLLFSLPALLSVYRVAPARALRASAQPLPISRPVRLASVAAVMFALFFSALVQSREVRLSLAFSGAVLAVAALLWLATRLLLFFIARLPRTRLSSVAWQGVAALARPGAGTTVSILALGLGTLVVLALTLVEQTLGSELDTALPANAPTVFLLDVQPDQWQGVRALGFELGASHVDSVPVVMARLLAIDGRTTDKLSAERAGDPNERSRAHWVLTREQRISWAHTLPPDNRIVEGALWSDPRAYEVSVEAGFARDLGARLGSLLRFDVQGMPIDLRVTSVRTVLWRSFSSNFFLVAEPGALDEAPHFRLGALRLPVAAEASLQNALATRYPNVTTLRVRELFARARAVLEQLAFAVRLLGLFAAATGVVILLAAIAASHANRARETALLKVLGVRRLHIVALFAVEYALQGAVAGLLGALGAYMLALGFTRFVLELSTLPSLLPCLFALAATIAVSTFGGLLASARALAVRPAAVLRAAG